MKLPSTLVLLCVSAAARVAAVPELSKRSCNADNVLRALRHYDPPAAASDFCSSLLATSTITVSAARVATPTCIPYNLDSVAAMLPSPIDFAFTVPISRISSACSCFVTVTPTATATLTATPTRSFLLQATGTGVVPDKQYAQLADYHDGEFTYGVILLTPDKSAATPFSLSPECYLTHNTTSIADVYVFANDPFSIYFDPPTSILRNDYQPLQCTVSGGTLHCVTYASPVSHFVYCPNFISYGGTAVTLSNLINVSRLPPGVCDEFKWKVANV